MKSLNCIFRCALSAALVFNASSALAVICSVVNEDIWDTGFDLEYSITNPGPEVISTWSVNIDLPGNATLITNWDSTVTSTAPLTVINPDWSGGIAPGETVTFGLLGSKIGGFSSPGCLDSADVNLIVPTLDDTAIESRSGNFGFDWPAVEGAVKYQIQETQLDAQGNPTSWTTLFDSTKNATGFGFKAVGHYGYRINQCNVNNSCSEFSGVKKVVVYQLRFSDLNSVTGTYSIQWVTPFASATVLENGETVASVGSGELSFRHRDSGDYQYTIEGLNGTVDIAVNRFDPNINIDQSLIVHDTATLESTGISLAVVFDILAGQLTASNALDPISGSELFARMWDAQNPAGATFTSVAGCDGILNNFTMECRPEEGVQAVDPETFLADYHLSALVNRFDLRDRRRFEDCGEHRMIFAHGGTARNLIIFEARIPNPSVGDELGCLPVANFWHQLSGLTSAEQRGAVLANFFLSGLPNNNVRAPIDIRNYTAGSGQIRTNQFFKPTWNLKEYKISQAGNLNTLALVTVKSNPVGALFDVTSVDFDSANFLQEFADRVATLFGGLSFISLPELDDRFNNNQSHASGALSVENDFAGHFENSRGTTFESTIRLRLGQSRSELTVDQVINRATAMTCAGCHQPRAFGLTLANSVGPDQRWPNSLGFVHVADNAVDGVFELSPALIDVFLPDRRDDLETFLGVGLDGVSTSEETFIDTPANDESIDLGDRAG